MQFNNEEIFEVINESLGDQYKVVELDNGQLWVNEATGYDDRRSFEGTPNQNAYNRIMKRVALENGNEFNSMYRDMGENTRINAVIDYAVDNDLIHSNVGNFLNARAEGSFLKASPGQTESSQDKLKRTLKERWWGIDSLTGASIDGMVTDVGHIYAGGNHPKLKHNYDNTREEGASDNRAYQNLEGADLMVRNDNLLADSAAEGVDVDDMEYAIRGQMLVDSLPIEEQPKAMVALGLATPEQVGLRVEAKSRAQKRLKR